jgi:predicted dehydrogenase
MDESSLSVAVVGLNFGERWIPAYLAHPDVASVAICDPVRPVLERVGDKFAVRERYASLEDVLAAGHIDAVHLLTPLDLHASQTLAVLAAGKHCAAAVTAALDVRELHEIVRLQNSACRNYMMMETAAFTPAVLHLRNLLTSGQLGDAVFARGEHHQDMEGWPGYWVGLPPLWYSTHALGPLLTILGARPKSVRALGAGRLPEEKAKRWGNPFPAETAIYELEDSPAAIEITRSLFQTAAPQIESFSIYGTNHGFDWGRTSAEEPIFHSWGDFAPGGRGRGVLTSLFEVPDLSPSLPSPLRSLEDYIARPVHEFVRSIVESRRPVIDAVVAASWTAAGLAAHESAMSGGSVVEIPRFG